MAKDEFVNQNEIQEVVPDGPPAEDEIMEEIDMRNNSSAYFDSHSDSVYLIASHPTLPLVVSGGGDEKAFLWSTHQDKPTVVAEFKLPESVASGGFTADGNFLVLGDMNGELRVYRMSKNGEKWTEISKNDEVEEIVNIVFHPALPLFAVLASDGSIWCYEASSEGQGALINTSVLSVHTAAATAVFTGGAKDQHPKLVSASEDGTIMLWDVYAGNPIYTVDHLKLHGEHPFVSIALSPAQKAVVVGSMDGQVFLIKLEDGTVLNQVDTTDKTSKPVTPSANIITNPAMQIEQATQENEEEEEEELSGDSIEGLAWAQKNNLVATGNVDGVVTVWDALTWRPRSNFLLQDSVTQLEFVPNSSLLVVSSMDTSVTVYNAITSEKIFECLGHSEGVLGFALQDKGKRIITAGDENVCLVFNRE